MNKALILQQIIEEQTKMVDSYKDKIATSETMMDLDEEATNDPDDYSRQAESGNLKSIMENKLQDEQKDLAFLKQLSAEASVKADLGALIETDADIFYVSISAVPFVFEGTKIIPISEGAPIFSAMQGKVKGDEFELNGKTYVIKHIY